jgi:putative acetyltransferase
MIKIAEIKDEDIEKAYQFCIGIFEELGWDKRFSYGLKNLKDFFNNSKEAFFLAKEGKRIIGCGGLKNLSKQEGLMKRLYIDKEFRGRGLAQRLFERIKKFAVKQNYKTIVLDTFKNNFRAQKFYRKQGFRSFKPKPNENWKESLCPELFEFRKLKLK